MKIFDSNYLFTTPLESPTLAFHLLTAAFALAFILSAILWLRRAKFAPQNPALRRFLRRVAVTGMWTSGIGLFLALCRYLQVDYIGMRIWMYLLFLYIIGEVGFFVYDYSERYPVAVWRLQEAAHERRYRTPVRQRNEPQRPRTKVRGKRRR